MRDAELCMSKFMQQTFYKKRGRKWSVQYSPVKDAKDAMG
jgi:hypothetical protein